MKNYDLEQTEILKWDLERTNGFEMQHGTDKNFENGTQKGSDPPFPSPSLRGDPQNFF